MKDPAPKDTDPTAKPASTDSTALTAKPGKILLGSAELFAGIPGKGDLTIEQIKTWLDDPKNHEILNFELPLGLAAGASQIKGLDKNPLTRAKIELGRQLYFDPRLVGRLTVSCASCHDPDEGFAAHTQFGVGIKAQLGGRNSPVSYNRILSDVQFWDGRADSLEDQAIGPDRQPDRDGQHARACVECLQERRRLSNPVRKDLRRAEHRQRRQGDRQLRAGDRHRTRAVRLQRGSAAL